MGKKPLWGIGHKTKVSVFDNVMGEYKKITKVDINFPKYCHFFISEIIDSLERNDISNPGDELDLEIETSEHPYCYEAFELIVRTFERKGYDSRIPTFHMEKKDGQKVYTYKWTFKKLANVNDLPF